MDVMHVASIPSSYIQEKENQTAVAVVEVLSFCGLCCCDGIVGV